MNLLEVQGLRKTYPAFRLEDVSFSVLEGAVMGLIGRNGAGKSTTLKSILGLVHPDAGRVEMFGREFSENERYIKENIGVVLGGIDFYPKKKVRTITDVTRRFYSNWQEEKYRHYLDLFAIDENKRVDQLSSGMRVKYLLALALSHNARLLILDEPTSGRPREPRRADGAAAAHRVGRDAQRPLLHAHHLGSGEVREPHHLHSGGPPAAQRHARGLHGALRRPWLNARGDHCRRREEAL